MMNCKEATRLLSDAQERTLSWKERAALKLHVMMCSGCRYFAVQMGTLRDIARRYAKNPESPENQGRKDD
jgi:predicted anti-sigma-YlaC factor YlaD